MTTCKRTLAHIRSGEIKDFGPVYVCGCEYRLITSRKRRWYLCSFHQGFEEALSGTEW